jgi:uncharacterized protein (DUF2235 family)
MPRRIAIFSDGTGQSIGRNDSNVLRLCKMLDLRSGEQIAIYDPGIGTHVSLNKLNAGLEISDWMHLADSNPDSQLLRHLRIPGELAFGSGAITNIRQLYLALVDRYEPGDEIHLFGFSRGAFTVRALAGLIYRCGVLQRKAADKVDTALGWYRDHYASFDEQGRAAYRAKVDAFRREFCRPANIRFLGAWDTVKSVGYLKPVNLPHTRHNPIIQTVRHALALDERRSFYVPTTWGGLVGDKWPAVSAPASFDLDATDNPAGIAQDVEEVWFPGNHSDVGGGYPADESAPANNSLRWMIREAAHCDLKFDDAKYLAAFPREKDQPLTCRHDEMRDSLRWRLVWSVADRTPRNELHNEPPPPRIERTRKPAGPRNVVDSLRRTPNGGGKVSIHETARGVYPDANPPWSRVDSTSLEFVSTRVRP